MAAVMTRWKGFPRESRHCAKALRRGGKGWPCRWSCAQMSGPVRMRCWSFQRLLSREKGAKAGEGSGALLGEGSEFWHGE